MRNTFVPRPPLFSLLPPQNKVEIIWEAGLLEIKYPLKETEKKPTHFF